MKLIASQPGIRILILSTYDVDDYVRRALKLGAAGYLLKDISPTELIASIRALKAGAVQISPQVVAKLMSSVLGEEPSAEREIHLEWLESLTRREREVFTLIARGCDNAQIGEELHTKGKLEPLIVTIPFPSANVYVPQ